MLNAILGTHQNRQTSFPSWWIRKSRRGGPELLPGIKQQSGPTCPVVEFGRGWSPKAQKAYWNQGGAVQEGTSCGLVSWEKTFLWFVSWMDLWDHCPHLRGHLLPAVWSADCESCSKSWTHEPAQVHSAQAYVGICICVCMCAWHVLLMTSVWNFLGWKKSEKHYLKVVLFKYTHT